jgi:hypothetical protein
MPRVPSRAPLVVLALALAAVFAVPSASASQLIDRGATNVRLAVNGKGEALVTYRTHGRLRRVLVWGAINAGFPREDVPQVRFQLDYAGGWGKYRTLYWRTFQDRCRRYDGPPLAYLVAACKAPDGTYWALQAWHVAWPDLGFTPWSVDLSDTWLEVSHWSGPVAKLEVWSDWVYSQRWHQLFGRLTYGGQPVHGFHSTRYGAPTDGYGRLIYVDTLDAPAYGAGWRRENSFLAHNPTGIWCYGFYPFDPMTSGYQHPPGYHGGVRGPGVGTRYRLSVIGPGVTPDISQAIDDPGDYDRADAAKVEHERLMNAQLDAILGPDKQCRQH